MRAITLGANRKGMDQKSNNSSIHAVVALGIPTVLFGVGLSVMLAGPSFFILGMCIATAAAVAFMIFTYLEFLDKSFRVQLVGDGLTCAVIAVLVLVIYRPAPVDVRFEARDSDYPEGTVVAGMPWSPNLTDVRVYIGNQTGDDYDNIDFTLQTNLVIEEIGVESSFPKCEFEAVSSLKLKEIKGHDSAGNRITMPIERIPSIQNISPIYRVRCDKLPSKEELEIVLGVTNFKWGQPNPVGPPRVKPDWIVINLQYQGRGRLRGPKPYQQCFIDSCSKP